MSDLIGQIRDFYDADNARMAREAMTGTLTAAQLDALPEGARVIDRYGDVSTKHDGLWHSFETAPMRSAKVAKWLPRLLEVQS